MNPHSIKPIAYYLPQFHQIPENSEWWGEGFTEWTNVTAAKPNFEGHYQPHIPKHMGFYDLQNVSVMKKQTELAKKYGIYGFCFHHYWFDGRKILELPINNYLASDIDFPFCLSWANENWTRAWDGANNDILLAQNYSDDNDLAFINDCMAFFKDPRYIKVDNKPMLLVYRADHLPDAKTTARVWRDAAKANGFDDLHLVAIRSTQTEYLDPLNAFGFDAAAEFPPHGYKFGRAETPIPVRTNPNYELSILPDYNLCLERAKQIEHPSYELYRGIMPSWDNTARKQNVATTFLNSSPEAYQQWFEYLVDYSSQHLPPESRFIFINAWNEWAEGAHLEPDLKHELAYLEATYSALG